MLRRMIAVALAFVLAMPLVQLPISAASAPGNIELSRKAATEGMVLLENDGTLPLQRGAKVALFGRGQINFVKGGTGSGNVNVEYVTNLLQGMQAKEEEGKVILNKGLVEKYQTWVAANPGDTNIISNPEMPLNTEDIQQAASESDIAVVLISRNSGEGSDRTAAKGDYYLKDDELDMVAAVNNAFQRVVVVMNVGGMIDMTWIENYNNIKSVLMCWQPGMEGGSATADVLCGEVNPSGKLTDTFARNYNDYPSSNNFGSSNSVKYEEDIYVGYRYFETADPAYSKVKYEFGYGLSYTNFELSGDSFEADGDEFVYSVSVKNTGELAGKEVVQVYCAAPDGQLKKPAKVLVGFAKTALLAPGEAQNITVRFTKSDFASYDDTGRAGENGAYKSCYILETGTYRFYAGNSIKNAGNRAAVGSYQAAQTEVIERLTENLTPVSYYERLIDPVTGEKETIGTPPVIVTHEINDSAPTRIAAEELSAFSENVVIENLPEEGKCVAYFRNGEQIEYKLNVQSAGRYNIIINYANGYEKRSDILDFYVNDIKQQPNYVVMEQTGEGSDKGEWYNPAESAEYFLNLPGGECTLKLVSKGNAGNILGYTIIPVPTKTLSANTKVSFAATQAETASAGIRTEKVPNSNDTCIAYFNADEELSYKMYAPVAGEYNISFTYANGRATVNDILDIYIDGEKAEGLNVTMPQTGEGSAKGEWYNFEDTENYTITLPEGEFILKIISKGQSGNLLALHVAPKEATVPSTVGLVEPYTIFPENNYIKLIDVYNDPSLMGAFIAQMSDEDLAYLSQGHGASISGGTGTIGSLEKYGIPGMNTADGPAGIRLSATCTAWPMSTSLACTWDVDLVEQVGQAVGVEAKANEVDIWLAPGMNIHRNPLCGRNFEYYSEDPLLTGKIAAAITKGVQSEGVGITIKHFAANNQEKNRNSVDTIVSERALREIYLKGFEIAVKESSPWCVMSSYNYVNGTETSERYDLITTVLRDEWGFDGLVMTDWNNNSTHYREAKAGNDVKMPSGNTENILSALASGKLERAELERNVERILNVVMRTIVFSKVIEDPGYFEPKIHVIKQDGKTKVKAADFAEVTGTPKVENCQDDDGGKNMGYLDAGGSITYYINVEESGIYDLWFRIASNAGSGKYNIVVDGNVVNQVSVVRTGGWQNWTTLDKLQIPLTKGEHFFKIDITQSGSNLNWIEFERSGDIGPGEPVDKGALSVLIEQAQALNAADYTAESWTGFADALANAQAVLADEDAEQDAVNSAYDDLDAAMQALVKVDGGEAIPVTKIKINASGLFTLSVKKTAQIPVTVEPEDATDPSVKWISTNPNIFTVEADGTITPHKQGTATLTAQSSNGLKSTIIVRITA